MYYLRSTCTVSDTRACAVVNKYLILIIWTRTTNLDSIILVFRIWVTWGHTMSRFAVSMVHGKRPISHYNSTTVHTNSNEADGRGPATHSFRTRGTWTKMTIRGSTHEGFRYQCIPHIIMIRLPWVIDYRPWQPRAIPDHPLNLQVRNWVLIFSKVFDCVEAFGKLIAISTTVHNNWLPRKDYAVHLADSNTCFHIKTRLGWEHKLLPKHDVDVSW